MVAMSGFDLPSANVMAQVGSALDLIVQVERLHDGSRRVTAVQEVLGYADGIVSMQDMFGFKTTGENADGRIEGSFVWSGLRPYAYDKIDRPAHRRRPRRARRR